MLIVTLDFVNCSHPISVPSREPVFPIQQEFGHGRSELIKVTYVLFHLRKKILQSFSTFKGAILFEGSRIKKFHSIQIDYPLQKGSVNTFGVGMKREVVGQYLGHVEFIEPPIWITALFSMKLDDAFQHSKIAAEW